MADPMTTIDTSPEALLPCPFCGGRADLTNVKYTGPADCWDTYAQCSDCGAASLLVHREHGDDEAAAVREIVMAWNRRTIAAEKRAGPIDGNLGSIADWRIDESAGSPILVFRNCSVIQDEQASALLALLRGHLIAQPIDSERQELASRLEANVRAEYAASKADAETMGCLTWSADIQQDYRIRIATLLRQSADTAAAFLAGAKAMQEAAAEEADQFRKENGPGDVGDRHGEVCQWAGEELAAAIRAIDPAALTGLPAPLPDYDDEVTDQQIAALRAHVGHINPDELEVVSDITQQAPDAEREELAKLLTAWQFGFIAAPSNLDLPVRELMAITGEDLVSQIGRAAELLRQPVAPVVDDGWNHDMSAAPDEGEFEAWNASWQEQLKVRKWNPGSATVVHAMTGKMWNPTAWRHLPAPPAKQDQTK